MRALSIIITFFLLSFQVLGIQCEMHCLNMFQGGEAQVQGGHCHGPKKSIKISAVKQKINGVKCLRYDFQKLTYTPKSKLDYKFTPIIMAFISTPNLELDDIKLRRSPPIVDTGQYFRYLVNYTPYLFQQKFLI